MKPELVKKRKNKSKKNSETSVNYAPVAISPTSHLLNVDHNFENGTVENMISKLLDQVFFEHNNGEFEFSTIEAFNSMCQDHQGGRLISPFVSVDIARRSNELFITKFLELFFPKFHPETRQKLHENIRWTMTGIIRALHTVLKFRSLLDQIQKIFFTSENYCRFFMERFPYTDKIDPFDPPEQVKCLLFVVIRDVTVENKIFRRAFQLKMSSLFIGLLRI